MENSDNEFPSPTTQTPLEKQFSVPSGVSENPKVFSEGGKSILLLSTMLL